MQINEKVLKDYAPMYMGRIQITPKSTLNKRTQKTTPSLNKKPTNLQNQIKT